MKKLFIAAFLFFADRGLSANARAQESYGKISKMIDAFGGKFSEFGQSEIFRTDAK